MAVELREHPRFNSRLEAVWQAQDGQSYACKIRDYSHSGLKLIWPHALSLPVGSRGTLLIQTEQQSLPLDIEWVFRHDDLVGVKLHQANDRVFLQLQELNQHSRAKGALSDEQTQTYLAIIEREVLALSDRLPKNWLPAFLEACFEQMNQARNTAEQQQWFTIEKRSKGQARAFYDAFQAHIKQSLQRWQQGLPELTEEQQEDEGERRLSLIQQSEFEDWLLAKVTLSHVQSKLGHTSLEVRQLLDTVGVLDPQQGFNPIGAHSVTKAFQLALETLSLPNEARPLAFDTFEAISIPLLQQTYQALCRQIDIPLTFRYRRIPPAQNTTTAASTLMANATPSPVSDDTQRVPAQALTQAANQYHVPTATNHHGATALHQDSLHAFQRHQQQAQQAFANIQSLLQLRQQSLQGLSATKASALPEAANTQVVDVLRELAQQEPEPKDVREQLEHSLAEQSVSLPESSRNAIDTLEQVTQNLLHHDQVADFIKPFIAHLSWPLMRLMLQDPSVLFNPEHPGRLLLNQLARLGKLTTSGEQRLSEQLHRFIDPVTTNIECDEHALDELLENIQSLVSQAERKAQQNRERVAQAAAGEYKLQQSRRLIERLIGKDSSGRTLPECVVEWLQQGWQPLLSLLLLREGQESKRFQGAVKLYRQVLVLFNANNAGRRELLERFRPMMTLAQRELDQLNGPQPKHQQWHDAIIQAAQQHLDEGQVRSTVDLPAFVIDDEETPQPGRGLRKVQNLQVGDWLLLVDNDDVVSIAWIADDGAKFACVNHSGMKVLDFSLLQLTKAFEEGRVKRLYEQEESAVDQSIDQLVQQIYRDLSEQANIDALTGLYTRQYFIRQLDDLRTQTQLSATEHTLCLINIDQFKLINQQYGIEGGDICLQSMATLLEDALPTALCARLGSNEFAVLLPHTDLAQGKEQAQTLMQRIESCAIHVDQQTFHVHASMGLASLSAEQLDTATWVAQAEAACALAKNKGGRCIECYQADHQSYQQQHDALQWLRRMTEAQQQQQLRVVCLPLQPLQSRHDQRPHIELNLALIENDTLRIPPISVRHISGAIPYLQQMDRWLLSQACLWMRDHPDSTTPLHRLMLRMTASALVDETLVDELFDWAHEHQIPLAKLCFIITDIDSVAQIQELVDAMYEIRNLGCHFALADFGTGQSSFEHMKHLPADYIKIDRRFIEGLHHSSADYALVKSTQDIAHFMAKKTIAEYNENPQTQPILQSIGVDFALQIDQTSRLLSDLEQGFAEVFPVLALSTA